MLDDLKYIHMRDKHDALGLMEKQYEQLRHTFELNDLSFPVEHIVYSGMGGSALAARLSLSWPGYTLPFEIVSEYGIPGYVSDKTLFIASSYSGNTEETLSALQQAEAKGAHIVVIASGGTLLEIAEEKGYPHLVLPAASQPRYATLYSFRALITVLEKAGLVQVASAEKTLHDAADFLESAVGAWLPTVAKGENLAKQLALDIAGTTPVIYAGPELYPVAYKWKISFNENAKNIAWCNFFPEFNHNEFLGWSSHPVDKPYRILFLESSRENERIQKRMRVTERMLSGRWSAPLHIEAKGDTLLEQMLYTMVLGDFTSIYLALVNGIDPTPVDLIERFKHELAK